MLLGSWGSASRNNSITSSVQRREVEQLKEEIEALQRALRLNNQALELRRIVAREEVVGSDEECEA
jgi:hypothetical protein